MSAAMIPATREALTEGASRCDSRSLFLDRFADPALTKDARKNWFLKLTQKRTEPNHKSSRWFPPRSSILYGRLMGRMMVNMAGGVMENAGLSIDRFGLPRIPGSTVKGCARRMVLQALHDWIATGGDRPSDDDVGAPCCVGFSAPYEMLAAIALVFGWTENDWKAGKKDGNYKCDFGWACGDKLEEIWRNASQRLGERFHMRLDEKKPWADLPSFGGLVAFLEAFPNRDPGLELDVLTPHHTAYYKGDLETAEDIEDPVPVYFPAVAPQREDDYFTFATVGLRDASVDELALAENWLRHGLELFGIGAKTNAGYGWFDTSEKFNQKVENVIATAAQNEENQRERERQKADEQAAAEERRRKKKEQEEALAGLSPDEIADKLIELLNPGQFDAKVRVFDKKKGGPSDSEKASIVRALKGPRLEYWNDFKEKAARGKLAAIAQAIHALNKQLHGDKMP